MAGENLVTLRFRVDSKGAIAGIDAVGDATDKTAEKVAVGNDAMIVKNEELAVSYEETGAAAEASSASAMGVIGGIAATVYIAYKGISMAVKAAMEWQAKMASLNATLSAAHVNHKGLATSIGATAEALSTKGGYGAPEQLQGMQQFVTETGNVSKAQRDNNLAMDLARTGMFSYTAAVKQVAGAQAGTPGRLNKVLGPILAVTKYTAGWTTAMKAANPTGYAHAEMMNKQATASMLMGKLQSKLGDQMTAYSHTAAGAMSNVGHAVDNAGRQIGSMLLPYVQKAAVWLGTNLPAAIGWLIKAIKFVVNCWKDYITWIVNAVKWCINFYNQSSLLKGIVHDTGVVFSTVAGILKGAFNTAVGIAKGAFSDFKTVAHDVWKVISAIGTALNAVASAAKSAGKFLGGVFGSNASSGGVQAGGKHPVARMVGHATGGYVSGGYGSGDTVPAMLAHGEYVVRAQAVQHIGRSNLDSMNQNATGASHGMGTTQVLQPVQITLGGQRILAEAVLKYALKHNALSGGFAPSQ